MLVGIHRAVPDLHTLHLDNVDPAVVAANPEASEEVTNLIVRYMTDGNIAAFGLESADPAVKEANNLNADVDIIFQAAEILNRYGQTRGPNGFPAFLPGLNFIPGLPGQSADSYDHNPRLPEQSVRRGPWAPRSGGGHWARVVCSVGDSGTGWGVGSGHRAGSRRSARWRGRR